MTALLPPHGPHWAIEETAARQILGMLRSVSASAHLSEVEARGPAEGRDTREYAVSDGIAYLSLCGPMTKAQTSWGSGCSTVALRRQIRQAAADPEVKGIMIRIDSPGGSVSGTADLADDVAAVNRKKPVYAYCEDACCSAAYWVASQCSRIYANPTAMVGSIGTYLVLEDWSGFYESKGIKVHVLSTGPHKGAGADGAALTDDQLADFQRIVDNLNSHFLGAVGAGRQMAADQVQGVATGQVWIGADALSRGLVDRVCGWDEAIMDLGSHARTGGARADADTLQTISGEDRAPAARTLAEESAAVLAAVRGLTERIDLLRVARESEGRALSAKALGHIDDLEAALRGCLEALTALRTLPAAEDEIRQRLRDSATRARLAMATSP
jgi:signal peptide peptidase SppA